MLPVLKEAGVVDSGGQGLVQILKGCLDLYLGKELDLEMEEEPAAPQFAYALSFLLVCQDLLSEDMLSSVQKAIAKSGKEQSVTAKAHTARFEALTNDPGAILAKATAAGIVTEVSLSNTSPVEIPLPQDDEPPCAERKPVGFVAVSIGDGLGKIFKDLGTDELIEGGQTMNPSTEDVIEAVGKVNADTVFVFPNNKNIILAASQAQTMVKDKKVIVVPTKTIPQGICCLINYIGEMSPEENETVMHDAIKQVRTGQLTYAVRDTHVDEREIHEGDYMGVGDKGILSVGSDLQQTALDMVDAMTEEDSELISIYYGSDITKEDADKLYAAVCEQFPDYEIELNEGGQPIYYYIISVE
ncbi:MAG: DAK2 domain-containing protein, partial [Lachnospiraceae bacterium]|nr:DAK2 domain-containing protein [Lachnospiraceae bacterium]